MFSLAKIEDILKEKALFHEPRLLDKSLITKNFSFDTRKLEKGEIFVCLEGKSKNGCDFLLSSIKKKPAAIIVEKKKWQAIEKELSLHIVSNIPVFTVPDTLDAMTRIAYEWRKKFSIPVFAITGTNGKTTTKDILASILNGAAKNKYLASENSFNNHIGLPITLSKINKNHDGLVLELGMSDFGEISHLSKIAQHDAALITNIGLAHLKKLKGLKGVLKAKLEILENFNKENTCFVNLDDPLIREVYENKNYHFKTVTYSMRDKRADYFVKIEKNVEQKNNFRTKIYFGGKKLNKIIKADLNLLGSHNVQNAIAAFSVAVEFFQKNPLEVAEYMNLVHISALRSEILPLGKGYIFNESYNANLNSIKAAVEHIAKFSQGNFHVALGEVLELGERAKEIHMELGRFVAEKKALSLGVFGSKGEDFIQGAIMAGMPQENIQEKESPESLAPFFLNKVKKGSFLLIKGSRGTRMERLVDRLLQESKK